VGGVDEGSFARTKRSFEVEKLCSRDFGRLKKGLLLQEYFEL
jgi:hypothetical protein